MARAAVEDSWQQLSRDADAVILHPQGDAARRAGDIQPDPGGGLAVGADVVEQVDQHLLDQRGVHRNDQYLLRLCHLHRQGVRRAPVFQYGAAHDLLQHLVRLREGDVAPGEPGDGEQVFRHPHQPLSVPVDAVQQRFAVRRSKNLGLQRRAGAHDRGQRGADVVGDGPKQVGVHLFPLHFIAQLLLALDLRGQRADDDGNHQHHQEGQGVSGQRHVELPERIGEHVVDAEGAHQRGRDAPQVAVRQPRHQRHGQYEQRRGEGVVVIVKPGQRHRERYGQGHDPREDQGIPGESRAVVVFHDRLLLKILHFNYITYHAEVCRTNPRCYTPARSFPRN